MVSHLPVALATGTRAPAATRYLKVVVTVGAIVFAGEHATTLETGDRSRTGKGRCDPASR
jgi:hypothetical protein